MERSSVDDPGRPLLSTNPADSASPDSLTTGYKVLRIVKLLALWICFGAFSEITGPVLPELVAQTSSTYDVVAQSVSMRGAGHAVGGIIGGFAVDRWFSRIDLLCSFWIVLYTGISLVASYIKSVPVLYLVFLAQGAVETFLQTAGYRIALKVWRERAAGPIHALHTGYGIGSLLVPQIVAPFLNPDFSGGPLITGYNSSCRENTTPHTEATTLAPNYRESSAQLEYPARFVTVYWILSGFSLGIGALFLIFHIYDRVKGITIVDPSAATKRRLTFRESVSLQSCSPHHPSYAGGIISTLFFYYAVALPLIRAFSKFVYSYARDGPCFSVQDAASLETAYFAAVTAGRFGAFVLSSLLHMKFILQGEVIGALACALVLFFCHSETLVLWIFVTALGFFTGPILPSAFAWANRYIEVTSAAQIAPQLGAAVGDVVVMSSLGYGYDRAGPYVIWYYMLALSSAMVVIAWALQLIGSLHGDRHDNE